MAAATGDLPRTGADVIGVAGIAGGLVAIGVVLLLVTRRSRFTA